MRLRQEHRAFNCPPGLRKSNAVTQIDDFGVLIDEAMINHVVTILWNESPPSDMSCQASMFNQLFSKTELSSLASSTPKLK